MAITSLVLGIAAFPAICCYGIPGLALGITSVVLGRIALGRIRDGYGAVGGYGIAQAGWICGLVASILAGAYALFTLGWIALALFSGFPTSR